MVTRSIGKSIARSTDQSIIRSIAYTFVRPIARSFRSLDRSMDQSIARCTIFRLHGCLFAQLFDRPLALSIDCAIKYIDHSHRSIARSAEHSLDGSPNRVTNASNMQIVVTFKRCTLRVVPTCSTRCAFVNGLQISKITYFDNGLSSQCRSL